MGPAGVPSPLPTLSGSFSSLPPPSNGSADILSSCSQSGVPSPAEFTPVRTARRVNLRAPHPGSAELGILRVGAAFCALTSPLFLSHPLPQVILLCANFWVSDRHLSHNRWGVKRLDLSLGGDIYTSCYLPARRIKTESD